MVVIGQQNGEGDSADHATNLTVMASTGDRPTGRGPGGGLPLGPRRVGQSASYDQKSERHYDDQTR